MNLFTCCAEKACKCSHELGNRVMVKQYLPKKKDEEEYQFTWSRGFWDMLKELHDLAGQHEVIAENTQGTVLKDLQQLITDLKTERRKGLQEGSKTQEILKISLQQLEKSRRQYEKAYKEAEKATDAYRKADADINLSRAEVEKYRNQMMIKNQQSDESKNEYASQLQQTNQCQRDHYNTLMPQVFEQFQTTDENRINRLQDFIKQCSNIERNVIPIINTCIDGMVKAADSINAVEDSKTVVDKYKSGFPIPQDIPFDDLSGCNTAESNSNHSTPKNYINPDRNTVKGNTLSTKGKKRGGLFGIFASSKIFFFMSNLKSDHTCVFYDDVMQTSINRVSLLTLYLPLSLCAYLFISAKQMFIIHYCLFIYVGKISLIIINFIMNKTPLLLFIQ
ncbi:hypothetical protein KUTeg_021760 [Tegillarca granosa]|uniref:F-BAR domain-containing protein n=1 Tax=Tegillarca granosa TaxID=220873 RepID=A0ABQ9E770_TEGGR|nr:hypothetical protein KUTeg_021760 [Tegillarca granosa]